MEYRIRPLRKEDIDVVIAIWEDRLGLGYPDRDELESTINSDEKKWCFVAETESEILGFAIGKIMPVKKFHSLLGEEALSVENEEIGLFDTVCVREKYQGNGVATKLGEFRLQMFNEKDIETCVSFSWIRKNNPDSSGILERFGFSQIGVYTEYWHEDSVENGIRCPDCGNPCFCDASLYMLKM